MWEAGLPFSWQLDSPVRGLDTVNVREVIAVRACVMMVPPAFLRGRDCEWHGDTESVADLKRVEVVYLTSEN